MRITTQIDSYYGRRIKEVNTQDDGWEIVLKGDTEAHIIHRGGTAPEVEEGWALLGSDLEANTLIFGLTDKNGNYLKRIDSPFDSDSYSIYDPLISDTPFTPTIGQFDPETPPEPVERTAEAPEGWPSG